MSPTERFIQLTAVISTIEERVSHCDRRLTDLYQDHKTGTQAVSEQCKEFELALSHIKRDIIELLDWKKELQEEWKETKKWRRSFGPNIIAALLTIVLAPLSMLAWNYFFPVNKPHP
jgi:hypothetical protein